ncbi:hypothetical protein [Shewanella sp. CG12_big_fil_rev_8_21_14_0_65_47_15]|uniref:hypothetical protein n=1 Tax=Shewanella sp. CG12_big_fil_rev_8_21_14_0_65_47_15 TaxID=1975537 RepID=UPI000CA65E12|nr:hypothetical protein [Shewanella sp. CG12_big_fil_rev_8_21_14_0_65_47_15]PIW61465.1 MAG: hypothetical protein COW15_07840 [Shewanella sp. CG12_big_fil_rev_8_21_14_0_65_47_15]
MKPRPRDYIQHFLQRLETNETVILRDHKDNLLLPIFPFFQLVHVVNLEVTIELILQFEIAMKGVFIRVDGFLTLTIAEQDYSEDDVRRLSINLFEKMRF